ncbi:AAA family ATPase [Staphylococcus pseudintermedius]
MKPLKLHLQNFGPFLDETIDFSRIQSNQLFLISGKTGSGKTMIFDGIVYALYGRASTEKEK